jgi:hypothetical protein
MMGHMLELAQGASCFLFACLTMHAGDATCMSLSKRNKGMQHVCIAGMGDAVVRATLRLDTHAKQKWPNSVQSCILKQKTLQYDVYDCLNIGKPRALWRL